MLHIAGREAVTKANLLRRLDAVALRTLATGLEQLDASLPLYARWIECEAVLFANHDFDVPLTHDPFRGLAWRSWRYGFSARLALANHGLSQLALAERVRQLCMRAEAVDVAAHDRLCAAESASPNPLTSLFGPNRTSALRTRWQTIAAPRVLRMAVQHARGEPVQALPDPAGGLLQYAVDEHGEATFWSDADRKHSLLVVPK